jgi:hypothetical protein
MQKQVVLPGQLDHPARHRQVGVRAVDVKFADRGVAEAAQAIFDMAHHGVIAHPARDLAAASIRPQTGHHQFRRRLEQALSALVAGARHHGKAQAGLAHQPDHLGHGHGLPGIVAVVDMRVGDRQRIGGQRHGRQPGAGAQQGQAQQRGGKVRRVQARHRIPGM